MKNRSQTHRLFAVATGLLMLAAPTALAQYSQDFENLTGSATGEVLTGQDGFYLPVVPGREDFFVFTYAGNPYGVPANPQGGNQFAARQATGTGVFPRAQRDMSWGTGQWMISYDVVCNYLGAPGFASDYIGSFSTQPYPLGPTYIHLFSWVDVILHTNWNGWYYAYDAAGLIHVLPGQSPGPEWDNLDLNVWYRFTTVIDYDANQITDVSITNLATGATASTTLVDVYLEGGSAGGLGPATGFRFFTGAGTGTDPDNMTAWDNLVIEPLGGGCVGDLDGDGDTDLADLGILLADFGCVAPGPCPGDLDGDGDTDLADLGILLADFGCTP